MTAVSAATPVVQGAFCSIHPERPAAATCTRCGSFACAEDRRVILDKPYCAACAALPEVDYLEAARIRYWGKRDTWTWLVGFGALFNALAAYAYSTHQPIRAVCSLILSALGACFFFRVRWARIAYLAVILLLTAISLATARVLGGSDFAEGEATGQIVGALVMIGVIATIYLDTRNRLFFRIGVSRAKLEKLWNT